jgi:alginate O-acetyltransferase complex protein AlgI
MIFATKAFLVFLPTVLVLYHLLRRRNHKYGVLLAASWIFYSWMSPQYLWVIIACTAIDYVAAIRIANATGERNRKRWLAVSIIANLGLLFAFKYTGFVYDNAVSLAGLFGGHIPDRTWDIILPLGISFHTFQGISYTVDVYRREIRAVRSFLDYALFVSFFPQLAAGPIVRAVEFLPQMGTPPSPTARQVGEGLHLFMLGLFKKLFIADQLDALFVSPVFGDPAAFDPAAQRWACFAWAAQIYCDFSGYSDMAMGLAKWFGFELPRNFNLPYLTTSITDFWRRWHLSLSTWLRDYLYFPLGGSRGSAVRTYTNLTIIFVLCGLWHGATWAWLVYGLYNGVLMSLHRMWDRALAGNATMTAVRNSLPWAILSWAFTLWLIVVGLVLIRMPSWEAGGILVRSLLGGDLVLGWSERIPIWVPLLMLCGLAGHALSRLPAKLIYYMDRPAFRAAFYTVLVVMLVTLTPGIGKTFIYIAF